MLFKNPVQLSFYAGLIILQSGASSYSAATVVRGATLAGPNSKQRDVVEEADTFLERLRALWKSSGGNRQSEKGSSFDSQSEESLVNNAIIKWRNRFNSISEDGDTSHPRRPSHRFEYRQLKVPVRLGLVRFSPRKPTALPKLNSASSFPVLMPSDPSWANNYTVTTRDLYRVTRKAYLRQATINKRRRRSGYYPEPESLPRESDASIRDDPLDQLEDHKDGSRWSDYFSGPEVAHDVCPSVSDWVARSEALDPYGNRLTVLQRIPVNGTVVNQYFFETYCASSGLEGLDSAHSAYYSARTLIECRGINKNVWNSRCKENFIWTYGKVITVSGDVGWSVIAIRGSCGCAIWRKPEEVIGRRRRLMRKPIRQG